MPKVTIIILNFNGLIDTRECITSVLQTEYLNFEVFVIDNGSREDQSKILTAEFHDPRLKIIRNDTNFGFAEGNNRGIRSSHSPYIILLNNDTIVDKYWVSELVKVAEKDKKIGALQPKILSYYEPEYFEYAGAAGGFIDKLGYPYARGRVGFELEKDLNQYDAETEIFWASGSCIMLRAEILSQTGLLPTNFFFHHEEIDLCWRIKNHGYNIVCAPKSVIYHKGLGSSKDILPQKVFYVHKNNLLLLARNMSIPRLTYTLPLRMLMDYVSCCFYLTKGQLFYILSVLKAHIVFLRQGVPIILHRLTGEKQKKYPAEQELKPFSVYFEYFVQKKKRFSEIIPAEKEKIPTIYYEKILPSNVIEKNNKQLISFLQTPYAIFFIFATLLCISWFRSKMLIASGEEALVFWNPERIIKVYFSPWYETGTGYPMPVVLPRVPLLGIVWIFSRLFPAFLSQALIYWMLLISGLSGMYIISRKLISKEKTAILIALFYLLNTYSMSQIWGRLLTTGTALWAYLPWFVFLFIEWLETGKKKYLLLFLFSSIPYSYAFGQPSSLIVLWIIAGGYTLFRIIFERPFTKIVTRCAISIISWGIFNSWWLYYYLKGGSTSFENLNLYKENLSSLQAVSQFFPLSQVLLLRQTAIFSNINYGGWYMTSESYWVSLVILTLAILGILSSYKNRNYLFIVLIFIIGLVLSKGTNPPFGLQFFSWIFQTVPATQSLRNSYEKSGIILLFSYAVFFGVGLTKFLLWIKSRSLRFIFGGVLVILCYFIIVWPLWKGSVYGAGVANARVIVPIDYNKINSRILSDHSDGRILHLPLLYGDGMRYNWPAGYYEGLEPSEFLFDNPSISKILRTPYFDLKYFQLYSEFGKESFEKLLSEVDVHYLILHKDNGVIAPGIKSSDEIKQQLTTYPSIKLNFQEKNLDLYIVSNIKKNSRIVSDNGTPVTYIQNSPTHYTVSVKNAAAPFNLVFKETYSANWQASINNEIIPNHKIIYDYANSWYIQKKSSYIIELKFHI